jgi:hypothetical protein
LATTLNIVQSKLAHLESENSISRRRVRELELELEECKKEVARERTRVLEREAIEERVAQDKASHASKTKASKSINVVSDEDLEDIRRYKEAVETKKGLLLRSNQVGLV